MLLMARGLAEIESVGVITGAEHAHAHITTAKEAVRERTHPFNCVSYAVSTFVQPPGYLPCHEPMRFPVAVMPWVAAVTLIVSALHRPVSVASGATK
jgi:hypothetical protein